MRMELSRVKRNLRQEKSSVIINMKEMLSELMNLKVQLNF